MSVLKDLITNFLEEMADFADPRERNARPRRGKLVPARIRTREDVEAVARWEGEGGRLQRGKERFGFFDH
ncbi:hypothetical protein [Hyphomonas sp.]|uniref:hypothetical protein n=1 Tax=Hyphomonas sp. TaxID=87 RepID=UPI0035271A07